MKSILIVKLSALGDVVHGLAVLHALKSRWPEASVDWVVSEAASGLIMGHPMVDRVVVYKRRDLGRLASNPLKWPALAGELFRLKGLIGRRRYDLALDLQGLFKSGLMMAMARARRKVGFSGTREFSSIFLNDKLPPYDPDRHAVDRYLDLARHVGAETGPPAFPLCLTEEEHREASGILERAGIGPGMPFAVLVPGTVWPSKHWSASGFAHVAKGLFERHGLRSLVAGGPSDQALAAEIEGMSGGVAASVAGQTALRPLAAIFSKSAIVVTVDTGPMHLAAAAGARIVALFGPTAPWRTGPYGKGHRVLRHDIACSPCFKRRCHGHECMKALRPEDVVEAAGELLTQQA